MLAVEAKREVDTAVGVTIVVDAQVSSPSIVLLFLCSSSIFRLLTVNSLLFSGIFPPGGLHCFCDFVDHRGDFRYRLLRSSLRQTFDAPSSSSSGYSNFLH